MVVGGAAAAVGWHGERSHTWEGLLGRVPHEVTMALRALTRRGVLSAVSGRSTHTVWLRGFRGVLISMCVQASTLSCWIIPTRTCEAS